MKNLHKTVIIVCSVIYGSLLTVFVSPLTMRLNWEADTPIFSASSFCLILFPLHKSEILCPGVPDKAIARTSSV